MPVDGPHQNGAFHIRQRNNKSPWRLQVIGGPYHLSGEEADLLFLKLRFLLQGGLFGEAVRALTHQITVLQNGDSVFMGFDGVNVLPIGMTRLQQFDFNLLETCGIFTIGQLLEATDSELLEVPNVTPRRLARIRAAADELVEDYRAWRRTLGEAPESDANTLPDMDDATDEVRHIEPRGGRTDCVFAACGMGGKRHGSTGQKDPTTPGAPPLLAPHEAGSFLSDTADGFPPRPPRTKEIEVVTDSRPHTNGEATT